MGARGKLFLLSVLLVLVNFKDIRAEGTQCPESNEGLAVHLPHETNCSLFYHCDWGVPVLKECPDGLHFNQILEVCDWPERAGCQGGGSGGSDDSSDDTGSDGEGNSAANEDGTSDGNGDSTGGNDGEGSNADNSSNGGSECPADNEGNAVRLPHESDCGLFYQCDWGVAVLKECPAGLHFNPILQVCDWPDDAGCQSGGDDNGNDGDNDGNDGEGNSDGDGEDDNDDTNNGDNDGGEGDGDSDNSGDSNGGSECPADNEGNAVHLPHESDCSLFYQCDWGVAVLKECPAGLHFNPVLQVCDWPDDAGCQSGGDDNGNDGDNGGNDGEGDGDGEGDNDGTNNGGNDGGEGDGDSDNSGDSNGGSECPADNEGNAVHLPHESDCSLFYQCDWGVAVLKECPAGLHFNPVLQVCDWPDDAGCQSGGDDNGNDGDNGGNDGEGDGDGEGDNDGTNNGGNDGGEGDGDSDNSGDSNGGSECPADNEGNAVHLPHESNCSLFYQCDWGVAVLKECPAGLHFNPVLQVCDWPDDAGCQSGGDDNGNDGDNGGNDGEGDGDGEGDNDGTNNGGNDGGEGDGDSDNSGDSNGGSECPADNEGNAVHLPHESNCSLFYQCDWGVAVLKECPAGLHFNPVLQVCDWPDDAGCQSGGDDNGNDGDNGGNDGEGDGDGEGDNDGTNNGGNDGGEGDGDSDNSGDSNGGSECPADNEGNAVHLPHESNCSLFYQCDWGVAVLKECPAGLHFNPVLQVCDWPDDAGCQSGGDDNGNDGDNGGNDGEGNGDGEGDNDGTNNGGNDGGEGDGDSDNSGDSNGGSECPADNEGNAVHLPHESDCSLFYQCDWGVAVLKECPAGLHFNPVLQVCDWPDDAGCQSGGDDNGNDGDNGGNDGEGDGDGEGDNDGTNNGGNDGGEGDGDSDNSGDSNGGSECPADNEGNAVHLPHESNCSLFYQCDWGVAVLKECPAGLHFNPVLQVCDWPDDAGCQSGGDDNGNDGDNGGNDGEGNGDGEGDNDGTNNGGNDGGEGDGDSDNSGDSNGGSECPADNEGNAVHLPHESDCGLFYQCDWGVAVLKECPAGLHFNPVLQVCDWPDDAGCQTGGGSVGDEGSDDVEVDNNGDGDNSGDNSDGGDNSDNDGNSSSEAPSTQDGSGFCNTVSCPAENEEYVTFIPNTQDCTRFCKCNWGLAYEFVCPAGLFFNPTLNVCDYPERAGCNSP